MIRQALRSLLRARAFSATAVLTVAPGIGVNTAIFAVIYSVLLDPLPYRDPGRLVSIAETHPEFPSFQVAAPDYFDWRRMSNNFEEMAAYTFQAMNQTTLLGHGAPERVQATNASHELFPMLGIQLNQCGLFCPRYLRHIRKNVHGERSRNTPGCSSNRCRAAQR